MPSHSIKPIGWVASPFSEKFGTPRQPGEATSATGYVHLHPPYRTPEAFRELESFSHLWLIFHFHQAKQHEWKPTVRPPRLGGNKRVGVFASRSPFRPNSLGLSVVRLEKLIEHPEHGLSLAISGFDLIDQTPLFDVKPYLPYADAIPDAAAGYSPPSLTPMQVEWTCDYAGNQRILIEEVLSLDPRPGYKTETDTPYGCTLGSENILWKVENNRILVLSVTNMAEE